MTTAADRRAAFAHLYPKKKPSIHDRRWIEGQRLDGSVPDELKALADLLARHREESVEALIVPDPDPSKVAALSLRVAETSPAGDVRRL